MTFQTTATPMNGKEGADLLELQFLHLLRNTPGLDFASSYHRLALEGYFRIKAYPADIPYPAKDIAFDVNSVSTNRGENEEVFEYVKKLETIREELIHRLQQVTEILETINPVTEVQFKLEAGDKPDELRIQHGLPVPVVEKRGGRNIEIHKQVIQDKNTGQFRFGGNR
jgi:hypothetical protein